MNFVSVLFIKATLSISLSEIGSNSCKNLFKHPFIGRQRNKKLIKNSNFELNNDLMKREFALKGTVTEYDSLDELAKQEQELMKIARESAERAYAPYSNFYVGAALLLKNGKIITGNNQENMAYPSGLCAERTAIFSAGARYPDEAIEIMAITAKSTNFKVDNPISPCGACRQVIAEYEFRHSNNIRILLMGEIGSVYVVSSIKELLPLVFKEKRLRG